jgi:hypothetical protein
VYKNNFTTIELLAVVRCKLFFTLYTTLAIIAISESGSFHPNTEGPAERGTRSCNVVTLSWLHCSFATDDSAHFAVAVLLIPC